MAKRITLCLCVAAFLLVGGQPAFAAGAALPTLVNDIGISLLLAGILAVVFMRIRIPDIAGFLVAGMIAGPLGLGLVTDTANIDTIAQLGFVLLLFIIGLEVDLRKIRSSGKALVVSGLLQYPLCVAFGVVITKILLLLGFASDLLGDAPLGAVYIGVVLAGSSTLIVVNLFQANLELDTEPGRAALGLLIFQDIWAVILLSLQPDFEKLSISPVLFSLVGIVILAVGAIVVSKYVASKVFRFIAERPETIVLAAVAWCFLIIFLGLNLDTVTEKVFGFNWHMAVGAGMGALIAGASIASFPYSREILTKVSVVKDFFVTLFFVGVGMTIPAIESWDIVVLALLISALAIVSRFLIFLPVLYFAGLDRRTSVVASARLAQISEFGLVIAYLGFQLGHIGAGLNGSIIFAFVITALLSPALYKQAYRLHDRFSPFLDAIRIKAPSDTEAETTKSCRIALLGFHRVSSSLLHELAHRHPELMKEIIVIDFNARLHKAIQGLGAHTEYGDISNSDTLIHAGVDRAKIVVSTIPDNVLRGITNRQLVLMIRQINPAATIIANAITIDEVPRLYDAGADFVYLERIEAAKAVADALESSLAGEIAGYREEIEASEGTAQERNEVYR
jgi:Kef-type K+ transport system membrane component KefB